MAWRTVMIQQPAKISLRRSQCFIEQEERGASVPLEDMLALVLESPQITLTSSLMAAAHERGVCIITCDDAHMPNGLSLPFLQHSRHSAVAKKQIGQSAASRKRLWQRVIRAKLSGQAACLSRRGDREGASYLRRMAKNVDSGDTKNREAEGARYYWPRLFSDSFRRGREDTINAALNYGYAVLRAYTARAQTAYGLIPAFGIHHDNALNAFNLTDDIIEMFRPEVDREVRAMADEGQFAEEHARLNKEQRARLAGIGGASCIIGGESYTISRACELTAAGLVSAIEHKDPVRMPVPDYSGQGTLL